MSSAMLAALTSTELNLAIFIEATFATGTVYLWSGIGPISWNGNTWTGLGALLSVSPSEETSTVEAKGLQLTLNGFDATLLPDVMNEFALLQPVTVYLGCFSSGSLIASPLITFSGRMDEPTVSVSSDENDRTVGTISINCESPLADMNVAVDRRYTIEDQQADWPGDLGFSFVDQLQEITINWGQAPTTTQNI